jgi:hypothetical protein
MMTAILLAMLCAFQETSAQAPAGEKAPHWWGQGMPPRPVKNPRARELPLISVRGNRFVNAKGDTVLFRGLAIADPDKIDGQGRWGKELFQKAAEMGARLIRIPVHPVAWRERTPGKYLALLDQAVEWCTDLGIYVIIDWHSIGNLKAELFQNPMYNTSLQETFEFWRTIARHFGGNTTVAFYEIFNEPTLWSGRLGRMSWDEWKKINEDIIAMIRSYDSETIPLVAGLDWAYDLSPLRINPVEAAGIGYVTHPYAQKRSKPWEIKWEENFGFAADQFPLVATEFGFSEERPGTVESEEYGNAIIRYLEGRGISWVAWVFDPEWRPAMMASWEPFGLTSSGEFFKRAMHGQIAGQK